MKQKGRQVYFMTGTDEHGQKVASAAMKENLTEKEFVDKIVVKFKEMWKRLSIGYDYFIRTTDKEHIKAVQYVLDKLYKKGDLYEGEYTGCYCAPCETFWTKLQVTDGICPECQRPVEEISETNIFFKLSKYQDWLVGYIKSHPDFIKPKFRQKEVLNYLQTPLPDLCITRPRTRLEWGIEVPFSSDHVVYVWFDALLNYISGCGYPDDEKRFNGLWPADVHLMAKDILRPHSIYWPIMLRALDIEPPKMVFAHGWWILGGQKISKSRAGVIDPLGLIDKYGLDAYRYFLLREIPFGLDGTYSEDAFISRINSELANDLGNLLNRTLTMVEKYTDAKIPKPPPAKAGAAIKEQTLALADKIDAAMSDFNFSAHLEAVMALVNSANKYIEDSAPWTLWKENKADEIAGLLYSLAEVLRVVSIAVYPVMPHAAGNMWHQLGMAGEVSNVKFDDMKKWGLTQPLTKIKKGKPLFPRIDVKER
jgi:methionyl-tRNA synthetase